MPVTKVIEITQWKSDPDGRQWEPPAGKWWVGAWGSHPHEMNDDQWAGESCDTEAQARVAYDEFKANVLIHPDGTMEVDASKFVTFSDADDEVADNEAKWLARMSYGVRNPYDPEVLSDEEMEDQ